MITNIVGKPGVQTSYQSLPRNIFYGPQDGVSYIPGPLTVDGTLSGNGQNGVSPTFYNFILFAGMPMGKVTSTGKYRTSFIGYTSVAYTTGGTTLSTDVGTAAELVRQQGTSGTFNLTGPPSAGGVVATTLVTYSAVSLTTGVITVTNIGVNYISGSFIQPADGSQTIITLLADLTGLRLADNNGNRFDQFESNLWAGGGIVDPGYIWPSKPTDTSLLAYIKSQIRANGIPQAQFADDLANLQ